MVVQRKIKKCIKKVRCTCRVVVCTLSHCCCGVLLEAFKYALLGKITHKCLLLINPSILLNNLMLVTLKNLGKTVLSSSCFFLVLPVCLALYLDSCQRLLKLTSQMQQSVKKWSKVKIPLRNTSYNIQVTQPPLGPT